MLESWGLCQQKFVFPAEILAFLLQRARSSPCREKMLYWLVVSTHLKNIDQLGLLFPIYGKTMFQTTNQFISETFRNLPKRPFFTWDIGRNDRRWMKHSDIPTGSQELSIQSWGQIPKSSSRHEWPWLSIETYWNILKHIETLKPMVTLGSPFMPLKNTLPRAFPSIKPRLATCPSKPSQTAAAMINLQQLMEGSKIIPLCNWMARVNPNIPIL